MKDWDLDDDEVQRALELDDRPHAALESIARDMEAESRPTVDELMAERYGPVDREQSARDYPQQPVDALTSRDARIIAKNHSPYTGRPTTTDDVIRRYALCNGWHLTTDPTTREAT